MSARNPRYSLPRKTISLTQIRRSEEPASRDTEKMEPFGAGDAGLREPTGTVQRSNLQVMESGSEGQEKHAASKEKTSSVLMATAGESAQLEKGGPLSKEQELHQQPGDTAAKEGASASEESKDAAAEREKPGQTGSSQQSEPEEEPKPKFASEEEEEMVNSLMMLLTQGLSPQRVLANTLVQQTREERLTFKARFQELLDLNLEKSLLDTLSDDWKQLIKSLFEENRRVLLEHKRITVDLKAKRLNNGMNASTPPFFQTLVLSSDSDMPQLRKRYRELFGADLCVDLRKKCKHPSLPLLLILAKKIPDSVRPTRRSQPKRASLGKKSTDSKSQSTATTDRGLYRSSLGAGSKRKTSNIQASTGSICKGSTGGTLGAKTLKRYSTGTIPNPKGMRKTIADVSTTIRGREDAMGKRAGPKRFATSSISTQKKGSDGEGLVKVGGKSCKKGHESGASMAGKGGGNREEKRSSKKDSAGKRSTTGKESDVGRPHSTNRSTDSSSSNSSIEIYKKKERKRRSSSPLPSGISTESNSFSSTDTSQEKKGKRSRARSVSQSWSSGDTSTGASTSDVSGGKKKGPRAQHPGQGHKSRSYSRKSTTLGSFGPTPVKGKKRRAIPGRSHLKKASYSSDASEMQGKRKSRSCSSPRSRKSMRSSGSFSSPDLSARKERKRSGACSSPRRQASSSPDSRKTTGQKKHPSRSTHHSMEPASSPDFSPTPPEKQSKGGRKSGGHSTGHDGKGRGKSRGSFGCSGQSVRKTKTSTASKGVTSEKQGRKKGV